MTDFHNVENVEATLAPQYIVRVVVTPKVPQRDAFTSAGQYVMASFAGTKPKPLAVASAPSSSTFTFLIKEPQAAAREKLLNLKPTDLEISDPSGKGFPLEKAEGKPLLLAGVGSGLAPLLSVLLHLETQHADFSKVTLLYGLPTKSALPEAAVLGRLQKMSLTTRYVFSKEAAENELKGYVQDHLVSLSLAADTVTFICGLRPMEEALIAGLQEQGMSDEQVFRNY
ncbi:MAG: hypothetical protein GY822_06285 [Deltaproteobacteria bacterium]|nr:hypothetical protein [Deltaproteobacteria bacterium]